VSLASKKSPSKDFFVFFVFGRRDRATLSHPSIDYFNSDATVETRHASGIVSAQRSVKPLLAGFSQKKFIIGCRGVNLPYPTVYSIAQAAEQLRNVSILTSCLVNQKLILDWWAETRN
jgi:hypothetical protein